MDNDMNNLLATVREQTQAMDRLTGAIQGLVDTNRELVDIVTGEGVEDRDVPDEPACYMDGTPITGG
tara:strand:+ start:7052 stop:7252 length:201 start_codon:yes stop_codon:yes gene_type:complete